MITQAHQFVVSKTPLPRDPPLPQIALPPPAQPIVAHTQKSVERPQNRHLKPFKSRAENGGRLDPRINKGGRPKILREESARYLAEKDENGVTNARKMIESLGVKALSARKDAVSAFRELRQTAEPEEEADDAINGPMTISMNVLHEVFKQAGQTEEKIADAYELPAE
jgi:hypothetical protein